MAKSKGTKEKSKRRKRALKAGYPTKKRGGKTKIYEDIPPGAPRYGKVKPRKKR